MDISTDPSPQVRHRAPKFGKALASRREGIGYITQGQAAEAAAKLVRDHPHHFASFSQQWLSRLEADSSGERIDGANRRKLRTLAYLLNWTGVQFEGYVGVAIGTVPKLENTPASYESQDEPTALSARVPVYSSVAVGIRGFEKNAQPETFKRYDLDDLPEGSDASRLYFVYASGESLYDDTMRQPVPAGALLLVESQALPQEGQLVVAYIQERELGLIRQYHKDERNVPLRSYCIGGPMFWSDEYPDMRVEGVVRCVSYQL